MTHVRCLVPFSRCLRLFTLLLIACIGIAQLHAADPPLSIPKAEPKESEAAGEVDVDIDLDALLDAKNVFPPESGINDGIWQLTAGPGRILVRVPLKATVKDGTVDLAEVRVRLRGGRFLAWHLVDDDADNAAAAPDALATEINPVGDKALPVNVPRFAKTIKVTKDGLVSWELDRVIFNATVMGGEGWYKLKLDRKALEALSPGSAPRLIREDGESPADFQRRKVAAEAEWRKKALEYREITKVVLKLPEEFKGPAPRTLWAVYETRANLRTLDFDGPEPMPWEFPMELLQALQSAVSGQATAPTGTIIVTATPAEQALALFKDGKAHLYSVRLLAKAFTRSTLLEDMKVGDHSYKLVDQLLSQKDATTNGILMKYLALNPSEASGALMQTAMQAGILDAASQLAAVQGMLIAKANDPKALESSMATVNNFLVDPKGPPPRQMLEGLLEAANANTTLKEALTNGLEFTKATDARFAQIAHATIELAAQHAMAAEWLNTLLGNRESKQLFTVVDLLNKAQLAKTDATNTEAPAASGDAPSLKGRITLLTTSHNMFNVVQNSNPQLRAMAWASLRNFYFDMEKAEVEDKNKWPRLMLDIAIAQTPTPPAAVEFFSRHKGQGVDDALIQFVLRGDDDAAKASAQSMLGSGRQLDQALLRVPNERDRYQFGLRIYETIQGQAPYSVGLMLDKSDRAPGAAWFGRMLADGQVPDAAQWVHAYGEEGPMMILVLKNDESLGMGAVDALVASAGGGFAETQKVAKELRADLNASPPSVVAVWNKLRREVFADRLKKTSGKFNLQVRYNEPDANNPGQFNWKTSKLDTVDVTIEGANVTVGPATASVADDDMLSIRLKSAEIGKLPGETIKALPLISLKESVDLRPLSNGGWLGEFTLAENQKVQLFLLPVKP